MNVSIVYRWDRKEALDRWQPPCPQSGVNQRWHVMSITHLLTPPLRSVGLLLITSKWLRTSSTHTYVRKKQKQKRSYHKKGGYSTVAEVQKRAALCVLLVVTLSRHLPGLIPLIIHRVWREKKKTSSCRVSWEQKCTDLIGPLFQKLPVGTFEFTADKYEITFTRYSHIAVKNFKRHLWLDVRYCSMGQFPQSRTIEGCIWHHYSHLHAFNPTQKWTGQLTREPGLKIVTR